MFRKCLCLPILLAAMTLSGCGGTPPDRTTEITGISPGDHLMVRFRMDALGMASSVPASFPTDVLNGANTTVSGTYVRQNGMWFVIRTSREELRIAKSAILTIATQLPPEKAAR